MSASSGRRITRLLCSSLHDSAITSRAASFRSTGSVVASFLLKSARNPHGQPAWTIVDLKRSANNRVDEAGRKARCCSVFHARAARIGQEDAAVTSVGGAFDESTDRFEYFRHRVAARHHFKQLFFSGEQGFIPLPIVDIGLQEVPKDDAPVRISQGEAVRVEPAVDPISAPEAGLYVVRMAGFDGPP